MRFTRIFTELKGKDYDERLRHLKWWTLEKRRMKEDERGWRRMKEDEGGWKRMSDQELRLSWSRRLVTTPPRWRRLENWRSLAYIYSRNNFVYLMHSWTLSQWRERLHRIKKCILTFPYYVYLCTSVDHLTLYIGSLLHGQVSELLRRRKDTAKEDWFRPTECDEINNYKNGCHSFS